MKPGAQELAAPPASAPVLSFLLADDHEIIRRGLKDLLRMAFGAVRFGEARTAEEALQLVVQSDWDVVLLDITMPGKSGLEVLAEMKKARPRTPVLILSGLPEEEFAVRSLRGGASGYLNKVTVADELVAAVRKVLAGGHYVTAAIAEKLALQVSSGSRAIGHETLSDREFQVLRLIAKGKTIKEIASDLGLSEKTVGTYRTRISGKLRLGSNVEIARYALQHHLVD